MASKDQSNHEIRKGSRPRQMTEKGIEMKIDHLKKEIKAHYLSYMKILLKLDATSLEGPKATEAVHIRLPEEMAAMIENHKQLIELASECEAEDKLLQEVVKKHEDLTKKIDRVSEETNEILAEVQDDAQSHKSHGTMCSAASHVSRRSRRSTSSHSSAAAIARAAGLRAKLKYTEQEQAQRIELEKAKSRLEKLRTVRELDMVESGIRAVEDYENKQVDFLEYHNSSRSVSPGSKRDYVEMFLRSQDDHKANKEPGTKLMDHLNPMADEFIPPNPWTTDPVRPSENVNESIKPTPTMMQLIQTLSEQAALSRLPPPEPTIFTGDPLKYPEWKSSFETLIERRGIPQNEMLHYLKKYLAGEAREAVEGYCILNTRDAYERAKEVLKRRYGDSFIVANAFRNKLENWPKIPARDGLGLRKYADFLGQCETAMITVRGLRFLDDDRENKRMLSKMPEWLVNRWARFVAQHKAKTKTFPPFTEFAQFVRAEANIACDPVTSIQALKEDKPTQQGRSRNRTVGASVLMTGGQEEKQKPATSNAPKKKPVCAKCQGDHYIDMCKTFLAMSVDDRKQCVKEKGLCFGCLFPGHKSSECRKKKTCTVCSKRHPTPLHGDYKKPVNENMVKVMETPEPAVEAMSRFTESSCDHAKSSMILPVWISHESTPSEETLTYALLDTQSDTTFLLEETGRKLGLVGSEVTLSLSTMTGTNQLIPSRKISGLTVRGYRSSERIPLPAAYTRDMMPANKSHIPTPEMARKWPQLSIIQTQLVPLQDCEVGLLIGYNCPRALAPREVITTSDSGPYGQRTDLGWSIVGVIDPESISVNDSIGVSHRILAYEMDGDDRPRISFSHRTTVKEVFTPNSVCKILERDFDEHHTDELGPSQDDVKFLRTLRKGILQDGDKHYQMPLPFKSSEPQLPNSRTMAMQRLQQLKNRLQKNNKFREHYNQFMNNMLEKGYAEKIPKSEWQGAQGKVWYIPHHGVYNPHKPDKIRVVFDASAMWKGVSLNQQLLQGPDMTNNLIGVLCRFRKEPIAVTCDIEQMFYQFRVSPEHRDFLRFLWWENGNTQCEPAEFRMTVHLFGATSSPGCANFGLKHIADASTDKPRASKFIKRDFYVDDGITSVATTDQAIKLVQETQQLCSEAGLRLHKFTSNDKDVLQTIPSEDRAQGIKEIDLLHDSLPMERALGVEWCIESDTFQFRIKLQDKPLTRRGVLATICSLYDPLGFAAPVILAGKMILQQICREKADWDTPLSDTARSSWEKWRSELKLLENVKVSRCLKPENFGQITKAELHHFSDASLSGYGQCTYLRLRNDKGQVHCSFVIGKSRVAPLKVVTVPRLELTAALVSTRVSKMLIKELEYSDITETFWTDSKVVLGYIANDARRFHVFVANRVQQIRDHSTASQWRYVQTSHNPADEASRGITSKELCSTSKWLAGPDFLWEDNLPEFGDCTPELSEEDPEVRATSLSTHATTMANKFSQVERFSSWHKARLALATCWRYMNILRSHANKGSLQMQDHYTPCSVHEIEHGEEILIKLAQKEAFIEEITQLSSMDASSLRNARKQNITKRTSPIHRLDPFVDNKGILRVGGRLKGCDLSEMIKHPTILPKGHHISKLIVRHCHERMGHAGRGITINDIRNSGYWILGCTTLARSIITKCVTCRKLHSNPKTQKMADLPTESYVGADYFGPWTIKEGRKELKRYGVPFTCLASRAIHVETANTLSTDSFINALRRFIAVRGPMRQLRSDQGTNFVGAARELKEAIKEIGCDKVRRFLLEQNCDFKTNVPSASHMGGAWERQIGSVRRILHSLMLNTGTQLDDESLRTFMHEAAAIVNGRPLTIDNLNDPCSPCPLTPNNILTMKSNIILPPPGEFQQNDVYSRKRWRRVQHLANEFWIRWQKEFLQNLSARQKWTKTQPNVQINDI